MAQFRFKVRTLSDSFLGKEMTEQDSLLNTLPNAQFRKMSALALQVAYAL